MHDLVLSVRRTWRDELLDIRHLRPGDQGDLASGVGWWWSLAGVGIGWVPRSAAPLLAMSPPLISEVVPRERGLFLVDEDLLDDAVVPVWSYVDGLARVRVEDGWRPEVEVDGDGVALDALLADGRAVREGSTWAFLLGPTMVVRFHLRDQAFAARLVSAAEALPPRPSDPAARAVGGSTVVLTLLTILTLSQLTPTPHVDTPAFVDAIAERLAVALPPPAPPPPPPPPDAGGAAGKRPTGEGKAGRPDATEAVAAGGSSRRERDAAIADQAGILGALSHMGLDDGPLGGSLAAGIVDGIGGLTGKTGTQLGTWGTGDRGNHLAGGGTADGIGGIGTGPGTGDAWGEGGDLGAKERRQPVATTEDPITMGGLSRDQIDRVVKARLNTIRFCYQRELTRDPSLGGKLVIKFTVARDGTVSAASAAQNTVGSASVAACVTERFFAMTFPEPVGGGIVVVRYPFVFTQG
ncbi:MAG: AgmX/PglI C-terminal domain-containing protein [Alphaproteobacteria bacterium]|nr:AgmX/PglI C-terminal domain-containing protein [Alphaproteobacteria bacterium]